MFVFRKCIAVFYNCHEVKVKIRHKIVSIELFYFQFKSNVSIQSSRTSKVFLSSYRIVCAFFFLQKMECKKSFFVFIVILFTTDANFSPFSYDKSGQLAVREPVRRFRKSDPIKMSYEIVKNTDFAKLFNDLHRYLSPEEVRAVSTLGLLSGALRVEESMREHLYVLVDDLLDKFNITTPKENMVKLIAIEQTINRDKSIVQVLNEMIRYTRNETTLDNLQIKMLDVSKEVRTIQN